jgi:tetratricopeptide (TPR) repeat protein
MGTLSPIAMKTFLYALLVAAVPLGLYLPLVGAAAPGAAYPADSGTRWLHIGLIAAAAVLSFFAYRARSGLDGPGLAAGLALAAWPAIPDAVASPFMVSLSGAGTYGAGAFGPGAIGSVVASVLAGEAALLLARRAEPGSPHRRALVAGLAAVLLVSAVFGQIRSASWSDPVAFWDRAADEAPRNLAALGASAGARADAGDREGAAARLRAFVDVAAWDQGASLGRDARSAGGEGAARAAALLLDGADPRSRETAERALRAAKTLAPDSVAVIVALAESELARGEFVGALKTLPLAVRRDPASAEAWDALARARLAGGRLVEAVEAAETACGLRPSEKRFVVTYAKALLAAGRGPEALRALWEALGPAPPFDPAVARAFGDAEVRLARTAISDSKPGQARRMLTSGLRVDPRNAEAKELLAGLDRQMETERPEAEALLQPPPGGRVVVDQWIRYAIWLCRWGEYEKAEPHFRRMMRDLADARVLFHYGSEFWESRGTSEGAEEAVKAYRQAIAMKPDYGEARNRLWQCLRTLGRIPEALQAADQFLQYDGGHPDAPRAEQFLKEAKPPAPGGERR